MDQTPDTTDDQPTSTTRLHEEPRLRGPGRVSNLSVEIDQDTGMSIALPRTFDGGGVGIVRIPYVLDLGLVSLHMDRAELERLQALIGRALGRPDPTLDADTNRDASERSTR